MPDFDLFVGRSLSHVDITSGNILRMLKGKFEPNTAIIQVVCSQEAIMNIVVAIQTRRSIRRFKPDPVPRETLESLLDCCLWSLLAVI
jgi:hypothetical protein